MKKKFSKTVLIILVCASVGLDFRLSASADNNSSTIAQLNQEIAQYQKELNQLGANKKTLQAAIQALDLQRNQLQAQVSLTQAQIGSTQTQIQQLGGRIAAAQKNIAFDQNAIAEDMQNIQKGDGQPAVARLFGAGDLAGFWQDYQAEAQVGDSLRQHADALQSQEQALAAAQGAAQQQQGQLAAQNQQLASQQQSLNQTAGAKTRLLSETNSKESTYQKLLAQAQAQLKSFTAFTQNAGGSGLLGSQTSCDAWGCYYSQRDSAWGGQAIDGSSYTMAGGGCLITSMAMVMTHYGYRSVTPATINANPDNFAAYYSAYLLNTISAGGATASRVSAAIDATLATGNPVIVGVYADGGTHYVVLTSGSGGNYAMRDPYFTGTDIPFSSHYRASEIFSVSKVVIGS